MFCLKSTLSECEKSKARLKKYFDDLLDAKEELNSDLHKEFLNVSEKNKDLESQIKVLEAQTAFLSDLISKMRDLLGVDKEVTPSLNCPDNSPQACEDSSSSEASSLS